MAHDQQAADTSRGRQPDAPGGRRARPVGLPVHLERHRLRRLHRDPGADHPVGRLVPGVGGHRDALRAARRGSARTRDSGRPPRAPGSAPPSPGTGASSCSPTTRRSSAPRTSGPSPASAGPRPRSARRPSWCASPTAARPCPATCASRQGRPGQTPVVIMVPGLDSVKEELQATAEYFLARGLATLAIDGPGQGESEYELPIEPAYEKVATAVVDFLQDRAGLDRERIGLFGVSLGGYYAARAAAYEKRLRGGRLAGRPVPPRPGLGRAPAADEGHLPGPLRRALRGRGQGQGRHAHPGGGGAAHRHPAARRRQRQGHHRPRLPPGAPGQGGEDGRARRLPRRQPRRHQPRVRVPLPDGRLDGRAADRLDSAVMPTHEVTNQPPPLVGYDASADPALRAPPLPPSAPEPRTVGPGSASSAAWPAPRTRRSRAGSPTRTRRSSARTTATATGSTRWSSTRRGMT